MTRDVLAALAVGGGFAVLLVIAELGRRSGWRGETTRKIVHLGGGLVTLILPWTVQSPWVVVVLGVGCSAVLFVGKRFHLLPSVHGVSRRTSGSEYYPLSIAFLFVLSEGRAWLFVSSLLVLAVADAFAALIGSRFGKRRYWVEDAEKSVEGSLAFLAIAWPAIWLPTLLLTDLPLATGMLAALLVAVLVTGFEAISLQGTDNLFVPIGVCVILAKITSKPFAEIVYQTLSMGLILGVGGWVVWRTRSFNVGGALTALLFCYGAWSLAYERWGAAPLAGVAVYAISRRLLPSRTAIDTPVRVKTTFYSALVPLLALMTANTFRCWDVMAGTYATAVGAAVGHSLWNHWARKAPAPALNKTVFLLLSGAAVIAAIGLPTWGQTSPSDTSFVARLALVGIVLLGNEVHLRGLLKRPVAWGGFQTLLVALVAAVALALEGPAFPAALRSLGGGMP